MLSIALLASTLAAAPPMFQKVATVEGVTEYRLPNGLRVLFVPDPSAPLLTVNLTVLSGSRHEGYGEKGMAHLLEHLTYKGLRHHPDPLKAIIARGGQFNGTTRYDRTNYFEVLQATDANLDFAVRLEADRLTQALLTAKDLASEMTVVRNEFEGAVSYGNGMMESAVRAAALPWHNYGRAVIGIQADIERVPLANLRAFYERNYQPDNAVLVLSGAFDERKAFAVIADSFGKIPRPRRALPATFTQEPTQDGERFVVVRRSGGTPALNVAWRIPAVSDPDFPALMVLQGVLGDEPQGRLPRALVETGKAASARCDLDELKEPGLFSCTVQLQPGQDVAAAKTALLQTMEKTVALTADEVTRSAAGWIGQREQLSADATRFNLNLSEWAAMGDWRLFFVQRDRLAKVTLDDVQRVWATYFKPQNRTLGEYVPTEKPDRVDIAPAPEVGPLVDGYRGREAFAQGEAFDPSPQAIEAAVRRVTLPNGAKLVLLPRKTRGQSVKVSIDLRYGSLASLQGQASVARLTALLLTHGTRTLDAKAFSSALQTLPATFDATAEGQSVTAELAVQRPQLAQALALVRDAFQQPAFEAAELAQVVAQQTELIERMKDQPSALGTITLLKAQNPWPSAHPLAFLDFAEQTAGLRAVTIEQVRQFHARHYGAQNAVIALVGDFDPDAVQRQLTEAFGGWTAKEKYQPIADPFVAVPATARSFATPDKADAWLGIGTTVDLDDASADAPAFTIATEVLGGGGTGRLFTRLRKNEGLTYGAYAWSSLSGDSKRGRFSTTVTFAPKNLAAVEAGVQAELQRWASLSPAEVEQARTAVLAERRQLRSREARLAQLLTSDAQLDRTMAWEAAFDAKLRAVTADEAAAVVRKYVDLQHLVVVKAGDFSAK